MEIKPFWGCGLVRLGSTRDEVLKKIGIPAEKKREKWADGTETEVWVYPILGMGLDFYSDETYILGSIDLWGAEVHIFDKRPIGMTEMDLKMNFPGVTFDEDFEVNGKNYKYDDQGLAFWVTAGKVSHITIFPKYDVSGEKPIWPSEK